MIVNQPFLIILFVLFFGLCIGSFLNVCIYRLPIEKSIVNPPSSCPECGYLIRFYDNIPIISYLLLGGKCRQCKTPISMRYPVVELLTGLMAVAALFKFGFTFSALIHFIFIAALIVITFIDIDHQIIPDIISLPGIIIFFLCSFAIPQVSVKDSLIGILAGGGILYAIAVGYALLKKAEGMGGGDIKLLAMIGALLGWQGVLFTVFISSAFGTFVGVIVMLKTKKGMKLAIPFGPFLAIGAILYIFFGHRIILWYLGIMR